MFNVFENRTPKMGFGCGGEVRKRVSVSRGLLSCTLNTLAEIVLVNQCKFNNNWSNNNKKSYPNKNRLAQDLQLTETKPYKCMLCQLHCKLLTSCLPKNMLKKERESCSKPLSNSTKKTLE